MPSRTCRRIHPLPRNLILLALAIAGSAHAAPVTLRLQGANEPSASSAAPAISADGNTLVFRSVADNLGIGQTGSSLFAWDRRSGAITVLAPGANGNIFYPAVSADGRYVAFETGATNLAPGPDSSFSDVLRLDRQTGLFVRASQGFNNSQANGGSDSAVISADGRYVAFNSTASNLVAGGTTTGREHVYLSDMDTGELTLLTRSTAGVEANKSALALETAALSSDGLRLVFTSQAENLAPVFAGNVSDVIVVQRDPVTQQLSFESVNRSVDGAVGTRSSSRGAISPNGRYVVFVSAADNIHPQGSSASGMFLRDLDANLLRPLPLPEGYASCNRGRVDDFGGVVMVCAPNAPATAQQLLRVPLGGAPELVSVAWNGAAGNASSGQSYSLSPDGQLVAFESAASNLISSDTNVAADVFVRGDARALFGLFADGFED